MRVCVNGGDVTGLIAAHLCRARGHSVVLVERGPLGQSALSPAHKYLERSQEVLTLLDALGVVYGEYTLKAGLLQGSQVASCPRKVSDAVHHAHWRKTRLTAMPEGTLGLSDPEVTSKRYAVSFDWRDFVKRLSTGLEVARDVGPLAATADLILETVPLWESRLVRHEGAMAVTLNMLPVRASKLRFLRWDVVYTPHTPGNAIHRLYHGEESGYVCEFSGAIAEDSVTSDLNYLFPEGWHVDGPLVMGTGKLVELQDRPVWNPKVRPIGRVACWDEGVTVTRVIRDVVEGLNRANA
jgi:hypothetical protein